MLTWRSEQERQATGMGARTSAGELGARAVELVIHIYTGAFTSAPDPTHITAA